MPGTVQEPSHKVVVKFQLLNATNAKQKEKRMTLQRSSVFFLTKPTAIHFHELRVANFNHSFASHFDSVEMLLTK
jgi:hypothetical protein